MRVIATATLVAAFGCFLISDVSADPLVGTTLAPPKVFDGVRPGMSLDDAKAALLTFELDRGYRDAAGRQRLVKAVPGLASAKYYVLVASNTIARIGIEAAEAGLVDQLGKRWGKPATATNAAAEGVVSWTADGWRVDVACRKPLCRLAFHQLLTPSFFGASAGPPGPLSRIRLGMTRDQVRDVSPVFATGAELPAGPEDVRVAVDVGTDHRVRSLLISGLPAHAPTLLTSAWGTPMQVADAPTWFDPKRGWRARFDPRLGVVQLTEYMPVLALLGTGDKLALPLLGLTQQQVESAYPKRRPIKGGIAVALPPTEFATTVTTIGLSFDPMTGRSTTAVFALPFETPQHKDALVAALEAKWGKGREKVDAGKRVLTFPSAKQRIRVDLEQANELVIDMRAAP